MAKKKTVIAQPDYEDIEPSVVEQEMSVDAPVETTAVEPGRISDGILEPGDALPLPIIREGEPTMRVVLALPRAVLLALADATFAEADGERALRLGLLTTAQGDLTEIGKLVLAGTDVTALRHQIATAWRTAHNAEIDGKQ